MKKYCNCGKEIYRYSKQCKACYHQRQGLRQQGINNPNYKNGLPKCIVCGQITKGYKQKYCSKKCFGLAERGNKHHNYQNGITDLHIRIRNLLEYKKWFNEIFKRDNYTCQECGNRFCRLEAHHVNISFSQILKDFLNFYNKFSPLEDKEILIRLSINWKPFWELGNGKTLCESCHDKTKGHPHSLKFIRK